MMKEIAIKKVRDVRTPDRGYGTDAGLDFYVPNDMEELRILPGKNIKIPSGIQIAVPEGWMGLFLNKSSIASECDLLVGAQVIDHGYSGEVHICLHNVGETTITIKPCRKIVQMVFLKVATPMPICVKEIDVYHERGSRGFGSTEEGK